MEVGTMVASVSTRRYEVSPDFIRQLSGYGLTTAEILYRIPDHPKLLQTYIWQDYDVAPDFPTLTKFLTFWRQTLDGALHSIRVGHSKLIKPAEFKTFDAEFRFH
jgi:uncharacterized protein Usg